jgi:hypothetical protein
MINISDELARVELGEPLHFRNLTMFPLLRNDPAPNKPDYLLAEDAIAHGLARITELSDGGSVPELLFENRADLPVLLLDGEELAGAKQNRVLNLTILAPAGRTIVIPVSCVEAGRWHVTTDEFTPAPQMMFARARAAKTSQVSISMQVCGAPLSDQSEVWNQIACKADRMSAASPTRRMSAIFERHAASVEEYVRAFPFQQKQAGAIFAINGETTGLDLFDRANTMEQILPKLLRSYALDAIDAGGISGCTLATAQAFLSRLSDTQATATPAAGLGKDVRLAGKQMSGAALWALDRYIHIYAFERSAGGGQRETATRFTRPTARGRNV